MKSKYYLMVLMTISLLACNQTEVSDNLVETPKYLPACEYGNLDYFNQMYEEMYLIIKSVKSDVELQTIIEGYIQIEEEGAEIAEIDANMIVGTQTYIRLDSLVREYMWGRGLEELEPEMSDELLMWADSLANTFNNELMASLFDTQNITEYDMVSLCMHCAYMRYLNEDMYSHEIVIRDDEEMIEFPVRKSDLVCSIDTNAFTIIEIYVDDWSSILDANIPINSLPEFFPHAKIIIEKRADVQMYYSSIGVTETTNNECSEIYKREKEAARRTLDRTLEQIERTTENTCLKYARRLTAYYIYEQQMTDAAIRYNACIIFSK